MKQVQYIQVLFNYQTFSHKFDIEAQEPMTIRQFLHSGFDPLSRRWCVRSDWIPWVNGKEVTENYILQDGDILEYLKPKDWAQPITPKPSPRTSFLKRILNDK